MTTDSLQIILTSATTIAAIVAPIATAIIGARNQRKLKKIELYQSTAAQQLSAFAGAYAAWKAFPGQKDTKEHLTAAAYDLALYIRDEELRQQLIGFGQAVSNVKWDYSKSLAPSSPDTPAIEAQYQELVLQLAKKNPVKY